MLGLPSAFAIDPGTENSLLFVKGRGLIEIIRPGQTAPAEDDYEARYAFPSIVSREKFNGHAVYTAGHEAKGMIGKRIPGFVDILRPIEIGAAKDTEALRHLMVSLVQFADPNFDTWLAHRARSARWVKPMVIVGIPHNATDVERRAVTDVVREDLHGDPILVSQPIAAAIGAGPDLDFEDVRSNAIIDIGGGTTDIAIISGAQMADRPASIEIGGRQMNEIIIESVKRETGLTIGHPSAEYLKRHVLSMNPRADVEKTIIAKPVSGKPKPLTLSQQQIYGWLEPTFDDLVARIIQYLENVSAEVSEELQINGIWLTGGGSLVEAFDSYLASKTGYPIHRTKRPLLTVIEGLGKMLEYRKLRQMAEKGIFLGKAIGHVTEKASKQKGEVARA